MSPAPTGARNLVGHSVVPLIFGAMAAVGAAWWLMVHVLFLAGFAVILGVVFYAGRRIERRRVATPQAPASKAPPMVVPNQAADQIAHLEQLAARPIDAIIATYERVAGYHRSQL